MALLALQSAVGMAALIGLAWAVSENRRAVNWRMVAVAVAVQIVVALVLLRLPVARDALLYLNNAVEALAAAAKAGSSFVFGYIGGGEAPFEVTKPANTLVIAFQLLPLVIVVGALSALLWHWRILPLITRGFAWALQRTLGIGGAIGLGSAANLFLGMVEAPLFVRAYLPKLTRSELFMLMTVGLSTVSGTVLVLYATTLEPVVSGAVGHILTASIISLPAAVLMSKVMIPDETATDADEKNLGVSYASSMDAVTQGTQDGLRLFLNIIAMLIVVFALVALTDSILAFIGDVNGEPVTLQRIFGWLFAPLVLLFGVPWEDAAAAGGLMGTKAILNEFVAYLQLVGGESEKLTPRTTLIMTYAMCGFANLGSVGMLISALSTLAPERRPEVAELGLRSFLAGNLATGMTGAVVGLITWG